MILYYDFFILIWNEMTKSPFNFSDLLNWRVVNKQFLKIFNEDTKLYYIIINHMNANLNIDKSNPWKSSLDERMDHCVRKIPPTIRWFYKRERASLCYYQINIETPRLQGSKLYKFIDENIFDFEIILSICDERHFIILFNLSKIKNQELIKQNGKAWQDFNFYHKITLELEKKSLLIQLEKFQHKLDLIDSLNFYHKNEQ